MPQEFDPARRESDNEPNFQVSPSVDGKTFMIQPAGADPARDRYGIFNSRGELLRGQLDLPRSVVRELLNAQYPKEFREAGLRDTVYDIQKKYLTEIGDPDLAMQYLRRLVKTGNVKFDPANHRIGIEGLGNEAWEGSRKQVEFGMDNPEAGGAPGTHDYFRQRFPGVDIYGETDTLADVMARYVYGGEVMEGPGRTLKPWELEETAGPLQGGEYAPWEGDPYSKEHMNFSALREPGARGRAMLMSAQPTEREAMGQRIADAARQLAREQGGIDPATGRPLWDWERGNLPELAKPRGRYNVETGQYAKPDPRAMYDDEGQLEPLHNVPVEEVLPKIHALMDEYGSINGVAQALADRHGGDPVSWRRQLIRMLQGQTKKVLYDIADKINVTMFEGQPVKPFDVPGFDLSNQPGGGTPGFGGEIPPQALPGFTGGGVPPGQLPGFAGQMDLNDVLNAVASSDAFSGAPSLFGDQGIFSYHPALDPRTWFEGAQEPTPQQSVLPPGMTLSELLPLLMRVGL